MHKVHVFHRIYAKNKQFLTLFSLFSTRSINHFTSRVAVKMFVETKMLFPTYSKACQILFSAVYVIYCFRTRTQVQEQCFASQHDWSHTFPVQESSRLIPFCRWSYTNMTRCFVKYKSTKLYCDKNIDIFQRVQTKITHFS